MDYSLTLVFLCANGEKSSMTIDAASPILAPEDANALMDTIIEKDIFVTKNGSLAGKYDAYLTQKQVTKFAIV